MSGPARSDAEERAARAGLLHLVAVIEDRLAQGALACEALEVLQGETAALLSAVHAARRADAETWFARQLRPKKPRNTAAKRQRELLAALAAGQS